MPRSMRTGPQEAVERALAAARCDDCVVIADETSVGEPALGREHAHHERRVRSRQLTVVAISRAGTARDGTAWCRGPGSGPTRSRTWCAQAEQAAAEGSPAEDAQPC